MKFRDEYFWGSGSAGGRDSDRQGEFFGSPFPEARVDNRRLSAGPVAEAGVGGRAL